MANQFDNSFIPSDPTDIVIRPLNKGVFLDMSPNMIPEGGFTYLNNYVLSERGLKRRPAWLVGLGGSTITDTDNTRMVDMQGFWRTNGETVLTLITSDYLYTLTDTAATAVYWEYTTGTVDADGTAVTGSGTAWDTAGNFIKTGDRFIIGEEDIAISEVGSDTSITLEEELSGTYTGESYSIRRRFVLNSDGNIDSTLAVSSGTNYLMLADGYRPPYVFDGSSLDVLDTSLTYCPSAICFYRDRVFMGNITETGVGTYAQRIRWSSATDFTSFAAADYLDLPYTMASVRKMLPLKQNLIIYTGTGVYLCRPTSYPDLPIVCDLLPNSSAGLVGQRAIASYFGGHFYVGRGDVHFLNENGGIEAIGSPAIRTLLDNCSAPYKIQAGVDVKRNRIFFALPQEGDNLSVILSYYYRTKGWGVEYKEMEMIASPAAVTGITWDTLESYIEPDTWDGEGGMDSLLAWDSISPPNENFDLYYGASLYLHKLADEGASDNRLSYTGEAIMAVFTTPEMDFSAVDDEKTFLRFGLKIKDRPSINLHFSVFSSIDGGYNWTYLGLLSIDTTHREGKVDFMITSSSVMFKVQTNSLVEPFEGIEYSVRVQKRGKEVYFT